MMTATSSHSPHRPVRIALLGLGTVGTSVAQLLSNRDDITLTHGVARDLAKSRDLGSYSPTISTDALAIAQDNTIDCVVELLGGLDPSYTVIQTALQSGKHVVTANKDVMATYGTELRQLATENGVFLKYEAAVCAGIPLINPIHQSLGANTINTLMGILNGTCNYILSRMSQDGWTYEAALKKAQELGFAEADPTNDVSGLDAAYKLAILANDAFGTTILAEDIYREGIDNLDVSDIKLAESMGYSVKLLGFCERTPDSHLDIRIHPTLVPHPHPLANIHDEYNALWLDGDAVGDLMFYGKGAGGHPTASGVCGDILSILPFIQSGAKPAVSSTTNKSLPLLPIEWAISKCFIRLNTKDEPGVVGRIGTAFGDAGVSIESMMQQGINPDGTASIIVITQPQLESNINAALNTIQADSRTQSIACQLRMLTV